MATEKQTNKGLDSIPEKIKDKVSGCAKEVKGMVFGIGWSQEQRKCLFNLAHKENVYPGCGEFLHIDCLYHSKETVQEDIKNILKKDFRGDKIILKTEEIQSENEDNLILLNKNKRKYKTLFFDNLANFDTDLLQSLIKLNKHKERGEIDIKNQPEKYLKQFEAAKHSWFESKKKVGEGLYNATYKWIFIPLIIIYSPVELPEWFRKEFEGIHLSPEPKVENKRQEEKDEKSLPKEETKKSCIFQKRDDFYRILYAHESFTLEATDGLRYIRYLLEHPYDAKDPGKAQNKFIPSKLYTETHTLLPRASDDAMATLEEAGMEAAEHGVRMGYTYKGGSRGDYTEDVVDPETKRKIKELENERDIAEETRNEEKVARVQADIDEMKEGYVKNLMGGGKSRKFISSFHKSPYDNISKAMNVVYDKIKKHSEAKDYKSMLTWKHLKSSIQFKNSCFFYEPEKLPDWIL